MLEFPYRTLTKPKGSSVGVSDSAHEASQNAAAGASTAATAALQQDMAVSVIASE